MYLYIKCVYINIYIYKILNLDLFMDLHFNIFLGRVLLEGFLPSQPP